MKLLKLLTASVLGVIASTSMASTIFKATDTGINIIYEDADPGVFDLYMFNDEDTGFTNPLSAPVGGVIEITGAAGGDYVATNGASQITLTNAPNFFFALNGPGTST
ncbi:MAG: hypothetical protein WBN36_11505 [Gammaproteobacteria bacterium]